MAAPVRYSPDVEKVAPDEAETIEVLDAQLAEIQAATAGEGGHALRAAHAKGHAVFRGVLTVAEGLPPELAQGVFATEKRHDAVLRLSTNAGDLLPDAVGLPRGLALKLFDVPGDRLSDGAGATTQDFIFVNGPEFPSQDMKQFLSSLKLLARTTDKGVRAKQLFSAVAQKVEGALESVGMDAPRLHQMGGAPNVHPLGETFYTKTAYRYGAHIAKLALFPVSPWLTALTDTLVPTSGRADALREGVDAVLAAQGGRWELRVQLNVDLDAMPVEDPTVHWDEAHSTYRTVATLDVPPQRSWVEGESGRTEDRLQFNIWNGLAAHRPLGSINRARNETYRRSAARRGRANGCPMLEFSSLAAVE